MQQNKTFMVFDVESVGLHGDGFSVGYVVIENSREIESAYYRCNPSEGSGTRADFEWVQDYVVPVMDSKNVEMTFSDGIGSKSSRDMRGLFRDRWLTWRGNVAILAADCPWPVEAKFLLDCVMDDPSTRTDLGPYPLIDVASVRLAAGLDPLATESRRLNELPVHHPLADARQSARLLIEALNAIKNYQ